jgi:hypothetical protein
MTAALNTAFGAGNVTVDTSPLNNLSYMPNFNSLWVSAGSPGDSLSSTEIANIEAYEATGHRVALIGENSSWTAWDNSILSTVGGSYSGSDTSDTLTPVVANSLTVGVTSLNTICWVLEFWAWPRVGSFWLVRRPDPDPPIVRPVS